MGVRFECLYLRPDGGLPSGVLHQDTPAGWWRVLSLGEGGSAWYRAEHKAKEWKTVFHLGRRKLALSNLPDDVSRFPAGNRVRSLFKRGVQRLALHPASMSKPCSPLMGGGFLPDGSNVPLVAKDLEDRDPVRHAAWVDHLREALPDVRTVRSVEREEDRRVYLKLRYAGGFELPAWRLSEGTLRLLALTLIPFISEKDALFLIEEPENGVHPQAVEAMYQAFRLSDRAQTLVASHSPVFVGIVQPEDLLCFTKEGGATSVVPGPKHPALRNWRQEVDLGTLFAGRVLE